MSTDTAAEVELTDIPGLGGRYKLGADGNVYNCVAVPIRVLTFGHPPRVRIKLRNGEIWRPLVSKLRDRATNDPGVQWSDGELVDYLVEEYDLTRGQALSIVYD